MNIKIKTLLAAGTLAAVAADAQTLLAGWDFQGAGVATAVNGYASDVGGTASSGQITTSIAQGTSTAFASGIGVGTSDITTYRFNNGFLGGNASTDASGTRSLGFVTPTNGSTFSIVVDTTGFENISVKLDWKTTVANTSFDGSELANGSNDEFGPFFVSGVDHDFTAVSNTWLFSDTSDNNLNDNDLGGGFVLGLDAANANSTYDLDLSSVTSLNNNGAAVITFTFNNAGNDGGNIFFDNIAVTGTVVPEPSAFAAIFGVFALVFVAVRRRK